MNTGKMKLVGMMGSPFVRRLAISMRMMGLDYEYQPLSIFRNYDELRAINPLVKVPTLIFDNGEMLVDSSLILDFLESISPAEKRLMPQEAGPRLNALRTIGIALIVMEKTVQLIYETLQRPENLQHTPWVERLQQQLEGACMLLEGRLLEQGRTPQPLNQADLTTAVAWRFVQNIFPERVDANDYPSLAAFSAQAEQWPEFIACPLD